MSWAEILSVVEEEAGGAVARRIEERIRETFGGERIYIARTKVVTFEQITEAAPGQPRKAAKALGIHPSTAYRILRRERIIR